MAKPVKKEVFRTNVENAFLADMVVEDRDYLLRGEMEAAVDDLIPANTVGLFDDSTSSDEDLEDLLGLDDDEYDGLF